ncbi:TonB-dependent receptor [Fretibacter rubidus]|uniref:TonB-dependent receptor n=1 Tax=Fretibacter rubidus TaxID=570162 RepID=UPI00352BB0F4
MKTSRNKLFRTTASVIALSALTGLTGTAAAQDAVNDEVIATGIRQSLANALVEKRQSDTLIEVIQAEDIGKLPDQNLAEVLENITGIQITRTAGVGTGVQIRGTGANRTEINGVSSVGSGFGRTGISFEDLPASLISSVEVTKVPEAATIEGSVGGTINLRTLRPLDLDERIIAVRVQGESSDLAESITPRVSGTIGNNWTNNKGQELGVVFSGSYTQQDNVFFNPRADRDAVLSSDSSLASAEEFDFLRIQFFQQNLDRYEYETLNLNGSLEYKPNDDLKFYVDGLYNDQERTRESFNIDLSGVANPGVVGGTDYTGFETIDFGTIDGPNGDVDLGSVEAALSGVLFPGRNVRDGRSDQLDPNLRVTTQTGARVTESAVFRTGMDWAKDRFSGKLEISTASSETDSPNFQPRLEFVNPNSEQPSAENGTDNGVPVQFDLSDGRLQFGIAQGLDSTPTTEQLLDPNNYQLGRVSFTEQSADNRETALRLDVSYDMEDSIPFITSFDAGYRFNTNSTERNRAFSSANYGNDLNRPNAGLFSQFVTAGPDNFGDADGRDLFIRDYLAIDAEIAFSDPQSIVEAINSAIAATNAVTGGGTPPVSSPTEVANNFFNINEDTHAIYAQANFNGETSGLPIRGNLGIRYVDTSIESIGRNVAQGQVSETVTESSYNFLLPRFNVVANVTDDILLRGGVARDIRRPDFSDLATSVAFGTGSNSVVAIGNPDLSPESVWSYDLSAEYYFTPSSLISVGVFHKKRTDLFTDVQEDPPGNEDANGNLNIDVTPPCEQGGIFNPIAARNINSQIDGIGICVPFRTKRNGEGAFTQTGVEAAFQYDLAQFEDRLGWMSGFGVIANYTYQKQGGSANDFASNFRRIGGNRNIFGNLGVADPQLRIAQDNLSKNSYNATLFYDKYGLSARARYTWRSSYTLPASVESFKAGAPLIYSDRGQLNANVTYDFSDNLSVGIEGVNLLQADQEQYCIKNNTLLCFNGFTDRRLIAGVNYKF